jgi:hypothetical protein
MYYPTNFDKWILVWMKKFKNTNEIPEKIQ